MGLANGNVIYQAHTWNFLDGNRDGIENSSGIEERLRYIKDGLGVDGLWLSSLLPVTWKDAGHKDAVNVALGGRQKQAEAMIAAANLSGLDVVADFAPSHSSDQHPYFRRALRDPRDTRYVFRDGRDGAPPDSRLSGSLHWEYDEQNREYLMVGESAWRRVRDWWPNAHPDRLDQFCLTSSGPDQPNWNHANPLVRSYLGATLRSWLAKGVTGFRIDTLDCLYQNRKYGGESTRKRAPSAGGSPTSDYLKELALVLDEFPDAYLMLESYPYGDSSQADPVEQYMRFYRSLGDWWFGRIAPFCFEITDLPWHAPSFKKAIDAFQSVLCPEDIPVYLGGNQKKDRLAARYGEHAGRAAAVMQLALPGVAVICQGDELGTAHYSEIPLDEQDEQPDSSTLRLPAHPGQEWFNVRAQQADPSSAWNMYQRLLALRKNSRTLQQGGYVAARADTDYAFGFVRKGEKRGEHCVVLTNFTKEPLVVNMSHIAALGQVLLSSANPVDQERRVPLDAFYLAPEEAVIIRPFV